MPPLLLPENETERMHALHRSGLLDDVPEESLDSLVRIAAQLLGTKHAFVSLVDEDTVVMKSQVGFDEKVFQREEAVCSTTILGQDMLVVEDLAADERFAGSSVVASGVRFYAGVPLSLDPGVSFGCFAVTDTEPRVLSATEKSLLQDLASHAIARVERVWQDRMLDELHTDLMATYSRLETQLELQNNVLRELQAGLSAMASRNGGSQASELTAMAARAEAAAEPITQS